MKIGKFLDVHVETCDYLKNVIYTSKEKIYYDIVSKVKILEETEKTILLL